MKQFMSWLSVCALLMSSMLVGMSTAVADQTDEEDERIEQRSGTGEDDAKDRQDDARDGEDDWDAEEDDDEWEDDEDEWEDQDRDQ